jgi:predicted HTH domain antitoxin
LQQYQKGEITLWKAAELAAKSLSRMMDEAQKRKIPHQYTVEDLRQDIEILKRTG